MYYLNVCKVICILFFYYKNNSKNSREGKKKKLFCGTVKYLNFKILNIVSESLIVGKGSIRIIITSNFAYFRHRIEPSKVLNATVINHFNGTRSMIWRQNKNFCLER